MIRLREAGPGAWRPNREAAELMRYAAARYKPLARGHRLDAWRAVEVLPRARTAPKLLRLPSRSWTALLRIVLGHPDPKYAGTPTGDGILLRLLSGEPVDSLRGDEMMMNAIRAAHPDKH